MEKFELGDKVRLIRESNGTRREGLVLNQIYEIVEMHGRFLSVKHHKDTSWYKDRFEKVMPKISVVSVFRNRFLELE